MSKNINAGIVLQQMELLKESVQKCMADAEFNSANTPIEKVMIYNNGCAIAYKISLELIEITEAAIKLYHESKA